MASPALRISALMLALAAGAAGTAAAQCPDGSPPPCRRAVPAPRRSAAPPPLDERTWIVLPFENVARVADIDWLREASVNLLYLDMSRWQDIRVIDDERVADLIREVPQARNAQTLSLDAGIAVARRAGAGRLVMGDLLKVGSRTQVVAKIFDVQSGQRVRTVREQASTADSLMPAFGRLAQAVLAAEPPPGVELGTVGTTSLDAYRAYVAGLTQLNRVDLDSARVLFDRAIALDSNFALAHYKQSVVFGWLSAADPRRVTYAERANRLAGNLPQRERALILGQAQTSGGRWGEACETYGRLVRADSADVDAWYNLGECNYHDTWVGHPDGDTTRVAFRGSWNMALSAFEQALAIDPTYHLAYQHIPDILLIEQRAGCFEEENAASCPQIQRAYLAAVRRDGDTLVTEPVPVSDVRALTRQELEAVYSRVWARNVEQSLQFARNWVDAGQGEPRAHLALARALLRAGRPQDAAREFALVGNRVRGGVEVQRQAVDRFELLIKLDSAAAAARFVDSMSAATPGTLGAFVRALVGRFDRLEQVFAEMQAPPPVRRFMLAVMPTMQGVPPDNLVALELGIDSLLASAPAPQRQQTLTSLLLLSMPYTLDRRRPESLQVEVTDGDPRAQVVAYAVRRDTARLRAALVRLDSQVQAAPRELPSANGVQWAAEGYLALGDSATALARLREFEARLPWLNPMSPVIAQFGNLTWVIQTWPRTWLRLADLAAAAGDRATAIRNYRRVLGIWQGADDRFAPQVARIRAALASLGAT